MSNIVGLSSILGDRKMNQTIVATAAASLILLHTRALTTDELQSLRRFFPITIEYNDELHSHSTPANLVAAPSVFDLFTVPIYKPEALAWYSANSQAITSGVAAGSLNLVLLRRTGEDKTKLNSYNAQSMIKDVPLDALDRAEMVRRLLAKYMPSTTKCNWKLFTSLLKKIIIAFAS